MCHKTTEYKQTPFVFLRMNVWMTQQYKWNKI